MKLTSIRLGFAYYTRRARRQISNILRVLLPAVLFATGCDPAAVSTIPDQLKTTACVVDSIPAGAAVIDDARRDIEALGKKVGTLTPIAPTDVDGPTALVNVATQILVCLEPSGQ